VAGRCDLDGELLVIREDDQEPVIRERLAAYQTQSQPLIEFFREKGRRLFEIDASDQTPDALLYQVCRTIRSPEAGAPAGAARPAG
jgi:adenylate kinase